MPKILKFWLGSDPYKTDVICIVYVYDYTAPFSAVCFLKQRWDMGDSGHLTDRRAKTWSTLFSRVVLANALT